MAKAKDNFEFKNKEERLAMLKKTAREINKNNNLDTLHFGNEHRKTEKISLGFDPLDELLGGGIPYGNFFTAWGAPGSGKSTIGHMLTASAQKAGKLVYYIALEPYDQRRAIQFGVDVDSLLIGEFPQAEQSLDTIIEFARKKLVDVIILDSIHSLSPKGEQEDKKGEKSVADDTMALLARKLSTFFKIAVDPVKRANVAVFMIGQTRTDLGGFIAIQKLTGGNALHHYSKGIIKVNRGQKASAPSEKVWTGGYTKAGNKSYETQQTGFECVVKVEKCQIDGMASEGTEIRVPYYYESGFYLPEQLKKEIEEEEREIEAQNQKAIEGEAEDGKEESNSEGTEKKEEKKEVQKKKPGRPKGSTKKKKEKDDE